MRFPGCSPREIMRWTSLGSRIMYRCRLFAVRCDNSRSPRTGATHDFFVIETRDWVNVVPITADRRVVMVRQFRHGIRDLTLEVPAGVIDATDPSAAAAAQRELREETGYACHGVTPLGTVHPNPALMNNRCHMFVAQGVELAGPTAWDHTEELEVVTVPLADVPALIREGKVTNALTVVAFHLLHVSGSMAPSPPARGEPPAF
jgi:ADP-ribose pyrophosphatase